MFSVLGAAGWIGSAITRDLRARGHEVRAVTRENWPAPGENLGHVIYAIGLTADFRERPLAAAHAHVSVLLQALEAFRYRSFLYLSSTRIYKNASHTAEDAALSVKPADPDDLYNITKLAGEAVCLALPMPTVRIARLSNVIGPSDTSSNFLPAVLAEARQLGAVTIRTSADSEKDYIALDEVVALAEAIALRGRHRVYNVASGRNVSHRTIADLVRKHLSVAVTFAPDAPRVVFPPIVVNRIRDEFGVTSAPFAMTFSQLVDGSTAHLLDP